MAAASSMIDFRATIIAEARGWIGTPYRHQGADKQIGCDCLGLVRGIWREIYGSDAEVPAAYASGWAVADRDETLLKGASRHLEPKQLDAMAPGDVLAFRWRPNLPAKHCGILVSGNRMVHAYESAGRVAEGALHPLWRKRIAGVFSFPVPGGD